MFSPFRVGGGGGGTTMIHHPKGGVGGGRCEMFQTHHFFRGNFLSSILIQEQYSFHLFSTSLLYIRHLDI